MNENGKTDTKDINPQKNLQTLFNQTKSNSNKSYKDNTKTKVIKEKAYKFYNASLSNSFDNIDENPNQVVSKILDNINKNSLSTFYDSDSEFKNKIDSLNLKFYLETEKYLCNQNKKIKTQTSLFIILFKQIIIYIEEIERLNLIILHKKYKPENIIKRTDDITQKQKEFQTKEDIIDALKKSQSNMEAKLLQALINENNLNKKIETLQKEIEVYKNQINSKDNNTEMNMNKNDKSMSISFNNDKKEESSENNNKNNNINRNTNDIKINKKKNSHNSICFTNYSNNRINNIIKINKFINAKSKSPSNFNNKNSSNKFHNFQNLKINIKRNHSEKDDKQKININKVNNSIKNSDLKRQNIDEMKYANDLNADIYKNENINSNCKLAKLDKINKSNTIDISESETSFKKIIICNKNIVNKEDSVNLKSNKKIGKNLKINLLLANSSLTNNINNIKKTKNEFNSNKYIYTSYNTITNCNKHKVENVLNRFKLTKNDKKTKMDINNINQMNINPKKAITKNLLMEQKSKSLLKKEKNNKNKIKSIINISNSTVNKKDNTCNQGKK